MPRTREQLERLYADLNERGDAYLVRSDDSHQIQMEQAVKLQNLLTVRNLFPIEVWKSVYQRELQRYDNAKATYEELEAALPMIWAEQRKIDLELGGLSRLCFVLLGVSNRNLTVSNRSH